MEVKMNKEIRDYQESMFWGLSFRQCLFSVLAYLAALGIYLSPGNMPGNGNRMAVHPWGGSLCSLRLFSLPRHDGRTVCMGSH